MAIRSPERAWARAKRRPQKLAVGLHPLGDHLVHLG